MGHITQEDPIGFAGGLNLYAYAGNNPATYIDPFGLCGIAGAAVSVGVGAALGVVTGGYSLGAATVDAVTGAGCVGAVKNVRNASRVLRRALTAAGQVANHGDEAHHIVAAGAKGARGTRDLLTREFGIDINDPANGVFLPAEFHRRIHTTAYYREVSERLSAAASPDEAREILRRIAAELVERAR